MSCVQVENKSATCLENLEALLHLFFEGWGAVNTKIGLFPQLPSRHNVVACMNHTHVLRCSCLDRKIIIMKRILYWNVNAFCKLKKKFGLHSIPGLKVQFDTIASEPKQRLELLCSTLAFLDLNCSNKFSWLSIIMNVLSVFVRWKDPCIRAQGWTWEAPGAGQGLNEVRLQDSCPLISSPNKEGWWEE